MIGACATSLLVVLAACGTVTGDADDGVLDGVGRLPGYDFWAPVTLPDGVEGRVVVQSAYNMLGYWQNPDATATTIRRDRFLDTGDIGRIEHGMLFINSRARDMIIRSGENIYPIEVESRIEAHPSVRECAVVGSDHPEHGQEVKAIVVPMPGATLDRAELAAFTGQTLAGYKVPTLWEERHELLPRNASGKVLKTVLLGQAAHTPDDHREH